MTFNKTTFLPLAVFCFMSEVATAQINPHHPSHGTPQTLAGTLYTNGYTITRSTQSHDGHGIYITDTSVQVSELVTGTDPDGTWPDFVFDKDYELPELTDLARYIDTCKHLPGLASLASMKEKPYYKVDDMVKTLLTKVEELTLYVIRNEKENKALEKEYEEHEQCLKILQQRAQQYLMTQQKSNGHESE